MRPRLIYICTFLLAASVLQLEIALTRIFSVLTWHHFTYMIISVALLGSGIAGSYLTLRGRRVTQTSPRWLAAYAFVYAYTTILAVFLVTRIQLNPLQLSQNLPEMLGLLIYYLLLLVPFFFAGLCMGSIVTIYGQDINRVYAADLLGASVGSLFSVLAIQYLGAPNTILLVALLAGLAGWLFSRGAAQGDPTVEDPATEDGAERRTAAPAQVQRKPRLLLPTLLVGVLVLTFAAGVYFDPYLVHAPPSKGIYPLVNPQIGTGNLDFSQWSAIARIDITKSLPGSVNNIGSPPNSPEAQDWERRLVFQDGDAPTVIFQTDGDPAGMAILDNYLQAAPYQVVQRPRVLVIGVGGGLDALIALHYQARHVTGVDVNPVTIRVVVQDYNDYAGGIFARPDVTMLAAEGRHFLSRDREHYDVIQLSGVDTFSALSSGAYALTENYLYTTEAMQDYWDHLTPDGVLSFARWHLEPPRETLRLVTMMAAALENRGVSDAARHIVIVYDPYWAETLLKKSPYTPAEVQAIRDWAQRHGFDVVYDPFSERDSEYSRFLHLAPSQREEYYRQYVYKVSPSSDDQPFFFDYYKWSNLVEIGTNGGQGYVVTRTPLGLLTLLLNLGQVLVLATLGIILPLWRLRRGLAARRGTAAVLVYFGALGLGFMFAEIALIQRLMVFLGGPTYSLSVTLFAILFFSGLGSFVARRWNWSARAILILAGVIVATIVLVNFALPWATAHWLDLGLAVRFLLAVLVIAPLAFVMGMPFPVGIRFLSGYCPEWIPWAWATNSFMTVFGSALCILLSMQVGFRWVFVIAGAIYLVGFWGLQRLAARVAGKAS